MRVVLETKKGCVLSGTPFFVLNEVESDYFATVSASLIATSL